MTTSALQTAYEGLIRRGRLLPNRYQSALVSRLAKLQDDLATTNNAVTLPGLPQNGPRGVYIYGSVGTGKSRLADLFTHTLPSSVTKRRVHFHEFMMDIHSRLHTARASRDYSGDPLVQIGRTIREESRVLCFDEFQVTDIADAMILSRLFGSIWREGGIVVSTSNREPNNLYENGLNRDVVVPFLKELQRRCEVWEIGGKEDYRMRKVGETDGSARVQTFFIDEHAFQTSLTRTSEGKKLESISIPVHGARFLDVMGIPISHHDDSSIPRFTLIYAAFDQLCESSRGSADYHALCSSTGTIFMSGLRKFRTNEKDAVRRFITLIDLAYEAKVRVICQSTVPLTDVFANIVPIDNKVKKALIDGMKVRGEGGSSSSMMSTFIGETEWSATGLSEASLATGGAGETDVGFAIGRAISRLYEMGSQEYGRLD